MHWSSNIGADGPESAAVDCLNVAEIPRRFLQESGSRRAAGRSGQRITRTQPSAVPERIAGSHPCRIGLSFQLSQHRADLVLLRVYHGLLLLHPAVDGRTVVLNAVYPDYDEAAEAAARKN